MVNLFKCFSQIKTKKVLLIGDLMLDTYTIGKVKRISPEAPVPVLLVNHQESRPGGAGNVVLNLISLGAQVAVLGRIGPDESGYTLKEALRDEGADINGILSQTGYSTPVKNRIVANNQQIVRIDFEKVTPLSEMLEQEMIAALPQLVLGASVIAISDYGKGLVTPELMAAVIAIASKHKIRVITDPKGIDFTKYRGSHIIKPNLSEVFAAANLSPETPIGNAAKRLLDITQAETLMVTRSEEGISLFHQNGMQHDFPVKKRDVNDVTGAGDTVLAVVAFALANGIEIAESSQLGNVAAGIAIEQFGCARVTLSQLAQRLLGDNVESKVFDEEHLDVLSEALIGRKYVVLSLAEHTVNSTPVFRAVHQLAKQCNWDLLVYVQNGEHCSEWVSLLASLHDIDYVITHEENLQKLRSLVKPAEVYELIDDRLVSVLESSLHPL